MGNPAFVISSYRGVSTTWQKAACITTKLRNQYHFVKAVEKAKECVCVLRLSFQSNKKGNSQPHLKIVPPCFQVKQSSHWFHGTAAKFLNYYVRMRVVPCHICQKNNNVSISVHFSTATDETCLTSTQDSILKCSNKVIETPSGSIQ